MSFVAWQPRDIVRLIKLGVCTTILVANIAQVLSVRGKSPKFYVLLHRLLPLAVANKRLYSLDEYGTL